MSVTGAVQPAQTRRAKRRNEWIAGVLVVLLVLTTYRIATGLQGLEAFKQVSRTMSPTLMPGDFFTTLPLRHAPVRGEAVIFRRDRLLLVYRVEGLPGDTLSMSSGRLIVNGSTPYEPYATTGTDDAFETDFAWQRRFLAPGADSTTYGPSLHNWGPLIVPPGDYFVLGDNRDASFDSRFRGFVAASDILKRPVFIYFSWDADRHTIRWRHLGRIRR